jgi:hypothetical protein
MSTRKVAFEGAPEPRLAQRGHPRPRATRTPYASLVVPRWRGQSPFPLPPMIRSRPRSGSCSADARNGQLFRVRTWPRPWLQHVHKPRARGRPRAGRVFPVRHRAIMSTASTAASGTATPTVSHWPRRSSSSVSRRPREAGPLRRAQRPRNTLRATDDEDATAILLTLAFNQTTVAASA